MTDRIEARRIISEGFECRLHSLEEMIAVTHLGRPKHGDTWGSWRYDAGVRVLICTAVRGGFEVDLDQCRTPADILHRLAYLVDKDDWVTPQVLGELVMALDDLVHLYSVTARKEKP